MGEVEPDRELSQAECDVLDERERQRVVEGWTPEHDDKHRRGELAMAAVTYGTNATVIARLLADGFTLPKIDEMSRRASVPGTWPFDREWWKPKGQRRNLVVAAALLLAEIERIDRADARKAASAVL